MTYSVHIERLGPYGTPYGLPTVTVVPSESEAIVIFGRAVELARKLPYSMQFSVIAPGNRLLINYTSERRDEHASDRATP